MTRAAIAYALAALTLSGCSMTRDIGRQSSAATSPAAAQLAGSNWTLLEFRSNDAAIGIVATYDSNAVTMALGTDAAATFKLDCNRGHAVWSATPGAAGQGSFHLGPVASTRAMCPPPAVGERFARDAAAITTYVRQGDRLSLVASSGTYVWQRAANR